MYSYVLYVYTGYKIYEYYNYFSYALSTGKGLNYVYNLLKTSEKHLELQPYSDWILVQT